MNKKKDVPSMKDIKRKKMKEKGIKGKKKWIKIDTIEFWQIYEIEKNLSERVVQIRSAKFLL